MGSDEWGWCSECYGGRRGMEEDDETRGPESRLVGHCWITYVVAMEIRAMNAYRNVHDCNPTLHYCEHDRIRVP